MSISFKPYAVIAENRALGITEEFWVGAQSKAIAQAFVQSIHGPTTKYSVYDLTDVTEICNTSAPVNLLPPTADTNAPCFLGIRVSAHSTRMEEKRLPEVARRAKQIEDPVVEEPRKPRKYLRRKIVEPVVKAAATPKPAIEDKPKRKYTKKAKPEIPTPEAPKVEVKPRRTYTKRVKKIETAVDGKLQRAIFVSPKVRRFS